MNDAHVLIEDEARQRINERVSRAAAPQAAPGPVPAPVGPATPEPRRPDRQLSTETSA